MDSFDGGSGKFRTFQKGDFETDWTKLAERSFGGPVYRVKLKLWRENFAVKSFDTASSGTSFNRRVMAEASEMAKLKFKYVVSVYGTCGDPVAMVTEYMSNGSLDALLASHAIMWPKKFSMIHEATMGMNFLHSLTPPLLHLNLKPANVLLDDHLHVKISDFGLIRREDAGTQKEFLEWLTRRGNISYIPPEAFTPSPPPPGTTFDVYSWSIVMWEILTQQKPYPGSSVTTVLVRVSSGKRPSLEALPDQRPPECEQMISILQLSWSQETRDRPAFSDTVRRTEALSDVLKIPGAGDGCGDEDTPPTPDYTLLTPHRKSICEAEDLIPGVRQDSADLLLSLLSNKDFDGFRRQATADHASLRFPPDDNTLLHHAVASGNAPSVRHVLSLGAPVDLASRRGYTPLTIAVLRGLHEIVAILASDGGADVNRGDADDWTPLHFAAQNGDGRGVRLLLGYGAAAGTRERAGWTALHLACQNGHENVVRILLSRLDEGQEGEEPKIRTPLHLAAAYGHVAIAKLLLSKGADPNAIDQSRATPLHLAAEAGHYRAARLLVTQGGSEVNRADARGYTPLHLAALRGHTVTCKQLLDNGASPAPKTRQGWTPVHLAAVGGHAPSVVLLEGRGADLDARGEGGWTPLHLACHHGREGAAAQLLSAGADPSLATEDGGWTALHLACRGGGFAGVLLLVARGAQVDARNGGGATPLHLAAGRGHGGAVRALLMNGAERGARDGEGRTPLELARRGGREEVVKVLEEEEE